ncbi:MAG: hypothetical protein ACO3UU_11770 [Minisyncoccia bacterium]
MIEIIDKLKTYFIELICTKEFILGFIFGCFVAGGIFSHWIFGNDNLWEQTLEFLVKITTNRNIDITS